MSNSSSSRRTSVGAHMATQRPIYQSSHTEGQLHSLNRKLLRLLTQQLDVLRKWRATYTTSQQLVSALQNLLPRFHTLLSTSSPPIVTPITDAKPPLRHIPCDGYSIPASIDSSSLHHPTATSGVLSFVPGLTQQLRARALDEISLIVTSLRSSWTTMDSYATDCATYATQADAEYRDTSIPHTEAVLLLWGRSKPTKSDSNANADEDGDDDIGSDEEAGVPPTADEDFDFSAAAKDKISRNVWQTVPISAALQALETTARVIAMVTAHLGALVDEAVSTLSTITPHHDSTIIIAVQDSIHPSDSHVALRSATDGKGINVGTGLRPGASPFALETLCEAWGSCGHEMVDSLIRGGAISPLGR